MSSGNIVGFRAPRVLDAPRNVKELVAIALVGATKASPEALRALAERWLAAFNGRDLDALLALYDDAAVHTSPNLRARDPQSQGKIVGKAKLREWWRDCFERLPGLRYDATRLTADGECVWMEYRRSNPGRRIAMWPRCCACARGGSSSRASIAADRDDRFRFAKSGASVHSAPP